jgi:hypothetical protein
VHDRAVFSHARDIVNKVLPNFDANVWQPILLRMMIDREILWRPT